ncbi:MAG TPA: hypothetical protein VHX18_10205, partial [Rhizomicrobium sp.]|nr:hypothetical protein [Rhizomicrobium sp.]
ACPVDMRKWVNAAPPSLTLGEGQAFLGSLTLRQEKLSQLERAAGELFANSRASFLQPRPAQKSRNLARK